MKKVLLGAFLSTAVMGGAMAAERVALPLYVGGRAVMALADGQTRYTYAWPGVYFEAQFKGDAVDVKVDDDQNFLYLYVDGQHKLTLTRSQKATVTLKDLGPGRHTVRLEKISETQNSTGTFGGFYVASSDDVLPAPQYDRRIEFIGDSFTVGYGNTSRGGVCTTDDVRDTTDTSQGFPPRTAKHFGAAYRVIAFSGRGIVRNYSDVEHGVTLPVLYQYALFDHKTPTPQDGWQPDVYVIGLGTNDFSTKLALTEVWKTREALDVDYIKTYIAFVQDLHAKNPKAHFILMAASDSFDGEFLKNVTAVVEGAKAAGISGIEIAPYAGLDHMACHGHPSLKDDVLLSDLLISRIGTLPKFAADTQSTK